jgi:hypothetical protein
VDSLSSIFYQGKIIWGWSKVFGGGRATTLSYWMWLEWLNPILLDVVGVEK